MTLSEPARVAPPRRYQPLAPAAGAFVAGVLLAEYAGGGMLAWCVVAAVTAAAWTVLRLRGASDRVLLIPLLVLLVAAGAARYRASIDPPPDDVARLVTGGRRLVEVEGILTQSPRETRPPADVFLPTRPYYVHSRMTLECERARVEDRWMPAHGGVQVTVREECPPDDSGVPQTDDSRAPQMGDRVRILGWLAAPRAAANPGGFDFATYLRRQGVRACLSTDHWEAAHLVERGADPLRWLVGAMGREALRRLKGIRSEEGRAVAAAIVLGRRDLLDFDSGEAPQDIEKAFIVTGTAHYLAVSGFNVALAAAVVLLVARVLGVRPRWSAVAVAVVVLAYVLMTELKPPVLRAGILIWILCLGWMLNRTPSRLNSLAAAVGVILLLRPGDLFTTSFQLSFAAVLGILWLMARIERMLYRYGPDEDLLETVPPDEDFSIRKYMRQTVALSIAASLVSVPLVAHVFHLVGWLAPIASIILAPLMLGLMAGSMALLAVGSHAAWLTDLVAAVPDGMARAVVLVVKALAAVPGGHLYLAEFSGGWLAVTYGLLAAWVWQKRLGITRRRLSMAALAAAAVFLWTGGHRAPPAARATVLAVGSGITTVLELPNGRALLYDAGSSVSYASAAETTLAPALWARGIERVDAVLLSHAHFDHFKDIVPLVDRFGVPLVLVPPTFPRQRLESDNTVIAALLKRGVAVRFFGTGDRLAGTGDVTLRALWPRGSRSQTKQINDGSLVLAVADHGRTLLLPGDLEPAGLLGLREAEPDLKAEAILWPHHGHAPEAVGDLARRAGARVLVISSGRPYARQPAPAWVAEQGVALYHTGEHGAVTLDLGPQGVAVRTFCPGPPEAMHPWVAARDEADAGDGNGTGPAAP